MIERVSESGVCASVEKRGRQAEGRADLALDTRGEGRETWETKEKEQASARVRGVSGGRETEEESEASDPKTCYHQAKRVARAAAAADESERERRKEGEEIG